MTATGPVALGLRVDVDTLRGTRQGAPRLLAILARHQIRATFFFSVGPDNMGRNLWRLFSPAFLKKMLRSRAPSLYGWDILLMGAAWPGPQIGPRCREIIRAAADAGHELGLHAWDHFSWQHRLDCLSASRLDDEHRRAHEMLARIAGHEPIAAAAPGWRVNETLLEFRDRCAYKFASDCRGSSLFRPQIGSRSFKTIQVPATLPTYDEIVGDAGVTAANYNSAILNLIRPDALNVYTIHAEVEGIALAEPFERLLEEIKNRGITPSPLGALLPADPSALPVAGIGRGIVSGRAGWVSVQEEIKR